MKRLTTDGVLAKIETVVVSEFQMEQIRYRLWFKQSQHQHEEVSTIIVTPEIAKELQIGEWYAFSMFYGRETTELPMDILSLESDIRSLSVTIDFGVAETVEKTKTHREVTLVSLQQILEHLKNYAMLRQRLWPK